MQAKDIMSKEVIVIHEETTIEEAIHKLIENGISGVPVVDKKGEILGLVTEKDLLVSYDFTHKIKLPIADFMSKEVVYVTENVPVKDISSLLIQHNIKRVPVVHGRKVIGIVSRRDVLKYIVKESAG